VITTIEWPWLCFPAYAITPSPTANAGMQSGMKCVLVPFGPSGYFTSSSDSYARAYARSRPGNLALRSITAGSRPLRDGSG
jgi:hypothetical protein